MLFWFFWIWVAYSAVCLLTIVWGAVRQWEIQIFMPIAFLVCGTVGWWILYLVVDKIGQHVSIH